MKFWVVLFGLIVWGCANDPVNTTKTNNKDVEVSLLFEHDGIKVYRFYDNGSYVYYVDARGSTLRKVSNGDYSKPQVVPTVD
jgi:hypothetical protein